MIWAQLQWRSGCGEGLNGTERNLQQGHGHAAMRPSGTPTWLGKSPRRTFRIIVGTIIELNGWFEKNVFFQYCSVLFSAMFDSRKDPEGKGAVRKCPWYSLKFTHIHWCHTDAWYIGHRTALIALVSAWYLAILAGWAASFYAGAFSPFPIAIRLPVFRLWLFFNTILLFKQQMCLPVSIIDFVMQIMMFMNVDCCKQ